MTFRFLACSLRQAVRAWSEHHWPGRPQGRQGWCVNALGSPLVGTESSEAEFLPGSWNPSLD